MVVDACSCHMYHALQMIGCLQEVTSRRQQLTAARKDIEKVPCRELFELSGRPSVAYEVRDYHDPEGRRLARFDLPFLFKAFETGQTAPPRAGTKNASKPRAATIHEYLDWTVTAEEPKQGTDLVSRIVEIQSRQEVTAKNRSGIRISRCPLLNIPHPIR